MFIFRFDSQVCNLATVAFVPNENLKSSESPLEGNLSDAADLDVLVLINDTLVRE